MLLATDQATFDGALQKVTPSKGDVRVVVAPGKADGGSAIVPGAVGLLVAKAFPIFSRKISTTCAFCRTPPALDRKSVV